MSIAGERIGAPHEIKWTVVSTICDFSDELGTKQRA